MSKAPTQYGTSTNTTTNAPPQYVADAQAALLGTGAYLNYPFLQGQPQYALAGFNPDQEMAFDLSRYQAEQAYTTPQNHVTNYGSYFAPSAAASAASVSPSSFSMPTAVQAATAQSPAAAQAALAQAAAAAQARAYLSQAAQLDPEAIRALFNPYQQDVINTSVQQLNDENARQQAIIRARQGAESAYGGNRAALQSSEQNRNFGNTLASTIAGLAQSGYNNSANLAMGNTQLRQQTGLANQAAQNTNSMFNAGQTNQVNMFNTGQANQVGMFNAGQTNQNNQFNTGQANQVGMYNAGAQNQFGLVGAQMAQQAAMQNAAYQQQANMANAGYLQQSNLFNAQQPLQVAQAENQFQNQSWQYQMQALQALLGIGGQQQQFAQQAINVPFTSLQNLAGIVPSQYGSSGTSSQPIYGPSTAQTIGSIAPLGIAALSAFSDETMKKDKEKLGKDPRTDLDIYKYRWKGQPKSAPKSVGPMAQSVEKKYPGSTARVGGKLAIKGSARQILGI